MVSVIIPTYNNPIQLERAVQSVFAQDYKALEVLVIDDGSTADYTAVINKLKHIAPCAFYYYKKSNAGPGLARQFGLNKAQGDYIQYLDSDDELLPHKLSQQVALMQKELNVVMVYGLGMQNGNSQSIHRYKHLKKPIDDLLISVLQVRKWHTSACLWCYKKDEYWENLFNGEDVLHDFNVAIKAGRKVAFVPEIVINIHIKDNPNRLSNASNNSTNYKRLVHDSMTLNTLMYQRLVAAKQDKDKRFANPLSERMFHSAMKMSVFNYPKEALDLAKLGLKLTKSPIKTVEFLVLILIVKLPIANKRAYFRFLFKVRRKLLSSDVHQFRYI